MEHSNPELDERIQGLPQERQDIIFDFTLAFDPGKKNVQLSRDYKAPWQLQINRATRQKQAAVYFGTSIFAFQVLEDFQIIRILRSMTAPHRSMITSFRCEMDWSLPLDSEYRPLRDVAHKDAFVQGFLGEFDKRLERNGVSLPVAVLQMNIPADTIEGSENFWLSLSSSGQE